MNRQPEFKVAVSLFKKYCKQHKIEISHSHILELVAIDRGYASYNVYRAQENKHKALLNEIESGNARKVSHIVEVDLPEAMNNDNDSDNSDFVNVQKVYEPIRQPDESTQAMYLGMDNPKKADTMPVLLKNLAPFQVKNKKEFFEALVKHIHWGRINGVAGEMHVNRENVKKLLAGKAQFEDEIIRFDYPSPFPQSSETRYKPGTISIIAAFMENLLYLNYGQWFIPGIGSVNFNNMKQELTGIPVKARWIDTHEGWSQDDIAKQAKFNVFVNGELVVPEIDNIYNSFETAVKIAEDPIFGGFAEVRESLNQELVYFHAYGYQTPQVTPESSEKHIIKTRKKEVTVPQNQANLYRKSKADLTLNKILVNPQSPTKEMKELMDLPDLPVKKIKTIKK
jgi:hypothetical protein